MIAYKAPPMVGGIHSPYPFTAPSVYPTLQSAMNSSQVSVPAKAAVVDQPHAAIQMNAMSANKQPSAQHEHTHKAHRIRGGGAGKDCFLAALGCFLCFECCEGCCDCVADIVCCPCEMCC